MKIAVSFFISLMCLAATLQAGEAANDLLSLDQCLQIAFQYNPQIIEARQQVEFSRGDWLEAEALPDPEFEMNIGGLKKDAGGSRKGSVDSFAVKQPLDPLGTRFLRGRIASDGVRISKHQVSRTWTHIATEIRKAYVRITTQEKAIDTAKDNLNVTRQFLTHVETRFQSGNAPKSDLIRSKIENARAENEFLVTQKDLRLAKGYMNELLGRPVEAEFMLADTLTYEPLRYQYQALVDQAQTERSDLRAAKLEVSQKKKGVWQALLKTIFPAMSLGIERTTEDFDNDTSLLLAASYPLWGFNLGEVKKAKAEKKIQEVRFEAFKRHVSLEVYQAFTEAELADKQVQLQRKSLEEANELLRQITLQYQENEIDFLNYLENIKTIKETRLGYFQALKNFKEKIAGLEQAFQEAPAPEEGENREN